MPVFVTIDVIERQTRRRKRIELRGNLPGNLPARPWIERDPDAGRDHVVAEIAGRADQRGQVRRRQDGTSVDQDDMQADPQRWHSLRASDRVGRCRSSDHEACGGQDAVSMRRLDRFVDLTRETEVVSRYDQRFQCAAPRRSRRNWKNSTPSRSRRFIICGLAIISPTMDAIFPERK